MGEQANELTTIRQVIDQAITDIRERASLWPDQERIIRNAVHRATALGLEWPRASIERRQAIEHEVKVLKATIASIGEAKAVEALQALEGTLNAIVTKGVDMLLDRVIGPN